MNKAVLVLTYIVLITTAAAAAADDISPTQNFLSTDSSTDSLVEMDAEQGKLYPAVTNMYNIFSADPMLTTDPGFQTLEVFKLTWKEGASSDGRVKLPEEFYIRDLLDCSANVVSETIKGMSSYKKSLSQTVTVGAEYNGLIASASFQASVGYKNRAENTQSTETVSTVRKLACKTYIVSINENADLQINAALAKKLKKVHKNNDWEGFVNTYGGYYITKAIYGAQAFEEVKISKSDAEKIAATGIDVSVGLSVKGGFGLFKGSLQSDTSISNEQKNTLSSIKTETFNWVVGVGPDKDHPDNFNAWIDKVQSSKLVAQPVQYSIKSLEGIFDKDLWPESLGVSEAEIGEMKKAFVEGLVKVASRYPPVPADITFNVTKALAPNPAPSGGGDTVTFPRDFNGGSQTWRSSDGQKTAIWQDDGNFVVYCHNKAVWSSDTWKKGTRLSLQSDGNLVVYDGSNKPVWSSNTYGVDSNGLRLIIQNDGNLVMYDRTGRARWASNTSCH